MFKAQFFRAVGQKEHDIGASFGLRSTTLAEAVNEALSWPKPEGANSVKILQNGQVVGKPGFKL